MSATVPCAHCGIPVASDQLDTTLFCCNGCRAAHAMITGCGLQDYYRLRTTVGDRPGDPAGTVAYDSPAFAERHVRLRSDGLAEIAWFVEGIHCTACLWLLEHLPVLDPGVKQARLAFGESRLAVVYDPAQTTPAKQASVLVRLGYPVRPFADDDAQGRVEVRRLLLRVAIAAASAIGGMHLSLNLYAGELTRDLDDVGARWFSFSALLVATPALLWSALPLYRSGLAALRLGRMSIDLTSTLVIAIGVIASVANLLRGSRETYVDALAMFIALLLGGRLAVLAARRRARAQAASLDGVLPRTARRMVDGKEEIIASDRLRTGDVVAVGRGEVLPCDGTALSAFSVDAAVLSGESRPRPMVAGGLVFAGTTCLSDGARLSVSAIGAATRLGGLIREAGRAADRPTRLVADVDRWQTWFVAVVALVAVGVFVGWWLLGGGLARGIDQAVAVVLVSCPCALGLAAPLVQAMATARAAGRGIVLRDPEVLETLGRPGGVAHFVFDKTGTLTEGRMRVTGWTWLMEVDDAKRAAIEALVLAAEAPSAHPVALAIVAYLAGREPGAFTERREITGQGVIARSVIGELRIGNERLSGIAPEALIANDAAVGSVGISLDGQPVARIACADPLRAGAVALVKSLRQRGAEIHVLSGDDPQITAAVGVVLGLSPVAVRGGQSPEEKAARITELKRSGTVVVIGDGINDAPALATADVGIGLRGGIEAALGSCRIVLVRHDGITGLGEVITGATSARNCVRRILTVSLAYNVVGVILAAAGVWGPLVCAVAMPLSSLTAVLMAGNGRYFRHK
ncbi:MAG: heavy metal translocating P-type ATPase [Planctomycetes bacterium]|jgi:Cu2+-exporting ATPase|nr:heavy metal translocating P-type ATPase [Planctomycetota bacterium]